MTINSNLRPYGVRYCHETRTSTIFDRAFRPIAKFSGRWPRVSDGGTPCDINGERCYGPEAEFFYPDNAGICDWRVRRRLRDLTSTFPVIAGELSHRIAAATAKAAKPVNLITKTFG